jgi:hypothetical protein
MRNAMVTAIWGAFLDSWCRLKVVPLRWGAAERVPWSKCDANGVLSVMELPPT